MYTARRGAANNWFFRRIESQNQANRNARDVITSTGPASGTKASRIPYIPNDTSFKADKSEVDGDNTVI
jgi:hypothetical protein